MKIIIIFTFTFAFCLLALFTSMLYHDLELYKERYARSTESNIKLCAQIRELKYKNRQ